MGSFTSFVVGKAAANFKRQVSCIGVVSLADIVVHLFCIFWFLVEDVPSLIFLLFPVVGASAGIWKVITNGTFHLFIIHTSKIVLNFPTAMFFRYLRTKFQGRRKDSTRNLEFLGNSWNVPPILPQHKFMHDCKGLHSPRHAFCCCCHQHFNWNDGSLSTRVGCC